MRARLGPGEQPAERPGRDGGTRLVVRERYRYQAGWARLLVEPVSVVSWFMSQKMLRGIRDRAQAAYRWSPPTEG